MPRPFIEFAQCQGLRWKNGLPDQLWSDGDVPGAASKVLSRDEHGANATALLRYPPRWAGSPGPAGCALEMYVLTGSLALDGVLHEAHCYCAIPATHPARLLVGEEGAIVLAFVGEDAHRSLAIGHDVLVAPWQPTVTNGLPAGANRKDLGIDPVTGAQTWLLGTMPMRWGSRPEHHPVVEEMFLLSGTLVGPRGTMNPGAYFWRPPNEPHGPFGSLTGTLALFRTIGGPLETTYGEETQFRWDPPYDPHPPVPAWQSSAASSGVQW